MGQYRTPRSLMVNVDSAAVRDILGKKHLSYKDVSRYTETKPDTIAQAISRGRMSLLVINKMREATGIDLAPAIYMPFNQERLNVLTEPAKESFVRELDTGQIIFEIQESTDRIVNAIDRLIAVLEGRT